MRQVIASTVLMCLTLLGCATVPEPMLHIASQHIRKTPVLEKGNFGRVQAIQKGDFHPCVGDEIVIFGMYEFWILSARNYQVIEKIRPDLELGPWTFKSSMFNELVDHDNDGEYDILLGGEGFRDVGLMDYEGNLIWRFQPDPPVNPNKMIASDLDKDGCLEFYVEAGSGVYQLRPDGSIRWHLDIGRFTSIDVFEDTILAGIGSDKLYQIDFEGHARRNHYSPGWSWSVIPWADAPCLLTIRVSYNVVQGIFAGHNGPLMHVTDLDGNIVFQKKIEGYPFSYRDPVGVVVDFEGNSSRYKAILMQSRYMSELIILSPDDTVMYQETIGKTFGLCVNRDEISNKEVILVGDYLNGDVVEYRYVE